MKSLPDVIEDCTQCPYRQMLVQKDPDYGTTGSAFRRVFFCGRSFDPTHDFGLRVLWNKPFKSGVPSEIPIPSWCDLQESLVGRIQTIAEDPGGKP